MYTFYCRWQISAAQNIYILLTKESFNSIERMEGIVGFEIKILIWVN